MESKKWWQSKTLWTNAAFAIAAFFPVVNNFIQAHPEYVAMFFSVVNIILRLVTKLEIS